MAGGAPALQSERSSNLVGRNELVSSGTAFSTAPQTPQPCRNDRTQVPIAAQHLRQGAADFFDGIMLDHIASSPGFQSTSSVLRLLVHRQNENSQRRKLPKQPSRELDSIFTG